MADEALRIMKEQEIDVVVTDIVMPKVNGMDLLRNIREIDTDIPIILITGEPTVNTAVRAVHDAAFDYLIKPFSREGICKAVRNAARQKDLEEENRLYRESLEELVEKRTQALMESEERYRRITEATTDYIFTVRIENGKPVETIHGDACFPVTGYTTQEFAADPDMWIRMVVDEDREKVSEQASRILAGKDAESIEHRIIRKDGELRWVKNTPAPRFDAEGKLLSYDGLISDITEHKRAEEALRESEERYRRLAENAQDMIWRIDANGIIQYVNESVQSLLGMSAEDSVGLKAMDYLSPDSLKKSAHGSEQIPLPIHRKIISWTKWNTFIGTDTECHAN